MPSCSGDYGIGFFGHTHNAGAYLLYNQLGLDWLCFLCNLEVINQAVGAPILRMAQPGNAIVKLTLRDSYHQRIYIQPLGLYLIAEAGAFDSLQLDFGRQVANVSFKALGDSLTSQYRLRVETPGSAKMFGTATFRVVACSPIKDPCEGAVNMSYVHSLDRWHAACNPDNACAECRTVDADQDKVRKRSLPGEVDSISQRNCCNKCPPCVRGAYELGPSDLNSSLWVQIEWITGDTGGTTHCGTQDLHLM